MDPLSRLSKLLAEVARDTPVVLQPCAEIDEVRAELERRIRTGSANDAPLDLQVEAVKKFWDGGQFESLRDARLVSFGLALRPWNDGRCLMEEPERFGKALAGLGQWQDRPRQFRRCYQGLVRSYFDYDGLGRDAPEVGRRNWRRLRSYLDDNAPRIRDTGVNPEWVDCVLDNRGLFSEQPCASYAQDMLDGRDGRVRRVRDLLGIADASWFTRELVLSQIRRACGMGDEAFAPLVDRLLELLAGNEVLRDDGLRMILGRYAQLRQRPEHRALKEFSVHAWGNPWLPSNEHRWGGVNDDVRQMVGDWLKLEFIELFFTRLAQDRRSDTRRLKFWAQYVPLIEDIRFALGSHAMSSRQADFVKLRSKLEGLIVPLQDANPYNNAFIMTMGDLVAVEFSGESNAFYGYHRQELPFDLSQPVRTPVDGRNSLKASSRMLWLSHQDDVRGFVRWEDRFMAELWSGFRLDPGAAPPRRSASAGTRQAAPSAPTPPRSEQQKYSPENLRRLAERFKARVVDFRAKGGALWVVMDDLPEARRVLHAWGFRYAPGKGWWRDDE
jgi:hypothetical protein